MPIEAGSVLVDASAAAALETPEPASAARTLISRGPAAAVETAGALLPRAKGTAPSTSGRYELAGSGDLRGAERWLLAGLVKENEGFMSRHVERRISLAISRRLASTSVTPNTMTLVSVAIGLAGAAFFLSTRPALEFAGALLFLLHSIVDGCDGELARLKFTESRLGGVLDFWGDNVVHSAVFGSIALAWHRSTGEVWALPAGLAAIAGTLLSAAFVYRSTMMGTGEGPLFTQATSGPPSALSRVADALARRDFIYVVVLLSAFGKAHWFLAAAAVGAPLYLLVLVGLASRPLGRSFS
jgi:phosphatidylglycerophosphate synthase